MVLIGGGEALERKSSVICKTLLRIIASNLIGIDIVSPEPEQDWYSLRSKGPFSGERGTFAPFTLQS